MATSSPQNCKLKYVIISSNAFTPTKTSDKAAGYDLYSAYDYTVSSMSRTLVKTDLRIAVPDGCYGRIAPRSGLALNNFLHIGGGVIDQDYRGNVGIIVFNFSQSEFKVNKGMRIAQLISEKIAYPDLEECKTLQHTDRGEKGFGSSGLTC